VAYNRLTFSFLPNSAYFSVAIEIHWRGCPISSHFWGAVMVLIVW